MIESCGQALIQSLHFVQRSKNSTSSTAPGGRSQSVLAGGAGFSGAASTCAAYSFAAFATERTESLKKSRRPYLGSAAISDLRSQISNLNYRSPMSQLRNEEFSSRERIHLHLLGPPYSSSEFEIF